MEGSALKTYTFKWLRDGMKYSPKYKAEIVNNLTFKGIFQDRNIKK